MPRLLCAVLIACACGGNPAPPAATTGTLSISISGLPSGTDASVSVSGPDSFAQSLTATKSLTVDAGQYTVSASAVSGYTAAVTGSPATVTAGQTAQVNVVYQAPSQQTGSLQVNVTGTGSVHVSGPGGYSNSIAASQLLTNLAAGSYTVSAGNATVTGSPAQVTAGNTATASVVFNGTLEVDVSGTGTVNISGPAGYSNSITATTSMTTLAPGTYTVSASGATIAGSPATVSASSTTTVSVSFPSSTGILLVKVANGNTNLANVIISGPDGYSGAVSGTSSGNLHVAPGTYTVTGGNYTQSNITWHTNQASYSANVTAGGSSEIDVVYVPQAPVITALSSRNYGSPGTQLSITGTGFVNDGHTVVNFDSTQVTPFNITSGVVLSFIIPAAATTGMHQVSVTTSGGTTANLALDVYTYDVFTLPSPLNQGNGWLAYGSDGNFWFVSGAVNIGKMTPDGTTTAYAPAGFCTGREIIAASDGNLWFNDSCAAQVGRITTAGVVTFFTLPNHCKSYSLANGPGGVILMGTGNCDAGHNGIYTFDPASPATMTEHAFTGPNTGIAWSVSQGYDGDVWVIKQSFIGRMTSDGTWLDDFPVLGAEIAPIIEGPNSHMWFSEQGVFEIDESGTFTGRNACSNGGFLPATIYDAGTQLIWCWNFTANSGVSSFDASASTQNNYTWPALNSQEVFGITEDQNGEIWIYTHNTNNAAAAISHLHK